MKSVEQVIATDLAMESYQPKFHLLFENILSRVFALFKIIFQKVKNNYYGVQLRFENIIPYRMVPMVKYFFKIFFRSFAKVVSIGIWGII